MEISELAVLFEFSCDEQEVKALDCTYSHT